MEYLPKEMDMIGIVADEDIVVGGVDVAGGGGFVATGTDSGWIVSVGSLKQMRIYDAVFSLHIEDLGLS